MNTRRTQPYRRKTGREPGATLAAMLRGRPAHLPNPQDARRAAQRRARRRKGLRGLDIGRR